MTLSALRLTSPLLLSPHLSRAPLKQSNGIAALRERERERDGEGDEEQGEGDV